MSACDVDREENEYESSLALNPVAVRVMARRAGNEVMDVEWARLVELR